MTTAQKISLSENSISQIESPENFHSFLKGIHEIFTHLLDEYNVKFGLKIEKIGLEKFKTVAKKSGNIDAINFLIWYEREYKKFKNDSQLGQFLEKEYTVPKDMKNTASKLLEESKKIVYFAYENF